MNRISVAIGVCLIASSCIASDLTGDFRKIINAQGYFATPAGESWPFPGGFLVMEKKGGLATFHDLPHNVKRPAATDGTKAFPAIKSSKKTALSVVLTGLDAIIGGEPGMDFSHSSSLDFGAIEGSTSMISYEDARALMLAMKDDLTEMLKTNRIFIVGVAVSSKKLSLSTSSNVSLDVRFNGKKPDDCTDNKNQQAPSGTGNKSNENQQQNNSTSKPQLRTVSFTSFDSNAASNYLNRTQSGGTTQQSSSGKAGGTLQVCMQNSNSVTMDNPSALVFALGAYEVTNPSALIGGLNPVMIVPKDAGPFNEMVAPPGAKLSGGPEYSKPDVKLASTVKLKEQSAPEPWPTDGSK